MWRIGRIPRSTVTFAREFLCLNGPEHQQKMGEILENSRFWYPRIPLRCIRATCSGKANHEEDRPDFLCEQETPPPSQGPRPLRQSPFPAELGICQEAHARRHLHPLGQARAARPGHRDRALRPHPERHALPPSERSPDAAQRNPGTSYSAPFTSTSRFPLLCIAETSPARSICSISLAARL